MRRPRIVIAEDHVMVAEGLKTMLGNGYEVVQVVTNGKAVSAAVETHRPDLLILDLSLPNRPGMDLIRELSGSQKKIRILVLTMYANRICNGDVY